jgi:tagatose 1,6-diphosphate aldolase GatY/KbaY
MALVTSKELLLKAQCGGYAVGAFNVENMEMAQAVIAAAEELQAPVLLQTTPSTLRYASPVVFAAMVRAMAERAAVPVAMHLDHGSSAALAREALEGGYTSIMIDGSQKPYEENVELTKEVVAFCHAADVSVEAELGCVGGKEDDLERGTDDPYTDPTQAADFVSRTGIDSLAVAIGTAHGVYKGEPKLDLERLSAIRAVVDIPLVLHGTSGVPETVVSACIDRGICKVNYATDLRIAYTGGVRAAFAQKPDVFDPKIYGAMGRESVKQYVMGKIKLCRCDGKA